MLYKLAIADDELFIRESLLRFIHWEELGFEVVLAAEDGAPVIQALKENQKIDAVFCDIQMQDRTGLDVAQYIAENRIDCVVVLLSGYQEFEFARKALKYGVEEYLLKPINLKDIRTTFVKVKELLDKKSEQKRQESEMESGARFYRKAMTEKFLEWGHLGLIQSKEDCRMFLRQYELEEEILEKHVCVMQMNIEGFEEYNLQEQEIITNILQMLAAEYEISEVYVMCGKNDRELELVLFQEKNQEFSRFEEFRKAISDAVMEICRIEVETAVILQDITLEDYVKVLGGDQKKRGLEQKSASTDQYMKILARQYLLILNMCEDYEQIREKMEGILSENNYGLEPVRLVETMKELLDQQTERKIPEQIWETYRERTAKNRDDFSEVLAGLHQYLHDRNGSYINISETVKKMIRERIQEDISLAEAAEYAFLSPNYFSRLFKEQTGEKFSEYCIRVKMERAAEMLGDPRIKIYEISERVGYKNIKYFYKLFKRVFSCTPSEYREKNQNCAADRQTEQL